MTDIPEDQQLDQEEQEDFNTVVAEQTISHMLLGVWGQRESCGP